MGTRFTAVDQRSGARASRVQSGQQSSASAACQAVDQVLELVRGEWRSQENRPNVNDWRDEFLVAAFARVFFRSLVSVREIACRSEADDAAVLTRPLIALRLRYL